MENKNIDKTGINSKSEIINIHDCLKMIGMKEVAAHIYAIPTKKINK
ncbi:MAG: hypothetical protein ACI9DJ_002808 [Algoriphagus sp.]|jgi:hypothetical protein